MKVHYKDFIFIIDKIDKPILNDLLSKLTENEKKRLFLYYHKHFENNLKQFLKMDFYRIYLFNITLKNKKYKHGK